MVNILLSGCNGKMGKTITECCKNFEDLQIVCGTDVNTTITDFPVYSSPADAKEKVDVIIDFSHPSALAGILDYAVKTNTPAVICTTGLDENQKQAIADASEKVAIFFSANMSLCSEISLILKSLKCIIIRKSTLRQAQLLCSQMKSAKNSRMLPNMNLTDIQNVQRERRTKSVFTQYAAVQSSANMK